MTTQKTIALTRQTFVGKVMSLVGYKFPSKEQASFNFMVAVTIYSDFGAPENEVCSLSTVFRSISQEVMGPDAIIFVS